MLNQTNIPCTDHLDFSQVNALLECIAHDIVHRRFIILFLHRFVAVQAGDCRLAHAFVSVGVFPAAYLQPEAALRQGCLRLHIRDAGSLNGNLHQIPLSFLLRILLETDAHPAALPACQK